MQKLENYKAGNYINVNDYKSFIPSNINCEWTWEDSEINYLLSKAYLEIGNLNGFALQVPNIDLYIQMHVKVEANKSSKMEGTRTTIDEELLEVEDVSPENRDDWQEVNNYVTAINYGFKRLVEMPISSRFIKELHERLMYKVRGENKDPGQFRKSQNWIGGSRPSNALYVPPVPDKIYDCISDLEKFINNDNIKTPELIKIAMIHYQFEAIHPFLDGNGRTGRILIPIYMISKNLISKPYFYISDYIEENKTAYYDFLSRVRSHNDMIAWIKFFLEATISTAINARLKFEKVVEFTKNMDKKILDIQGNPSNIRKILDILYTTPRISRKSLMNKTGLKSSTYNNIINSMLKNNILDEDTGFSRNQILVFTNYINLFR
ncbi:Fic family protein [bacterium]|nr:Fic family protein [bacterium]